MYSRSIVSALSYCYHLSFCCLLCSSCGVHYLPLQTDVFTDDLLLLFSISSPSANAVLCTCTPFHHTVPCSTIKLFLDHWAHSIVPSDWCVTSIQYGNLTASNSTLSFRCNAFYHPYKEPEKLFQAMPERLSWILQGTYCHLLLMKVSLFWEVHYHRKLFLISLRLSSQSY